MRAFSFAELPCQKATFVPASNVVCQGRLPTGDARTHSCQLEEKPHTAVSREPTYKPRLK